MKAAVLQKEGTISIEDVETPQAAPGEVVIKVNYCGICGSDLHLMDGASILAGTIMGHEVSGVIAEIGEGVEGWSVGQRVVPLPFTSCGHCYECIHGVPNLCRQAIVFGCDVSVLGALAEYVKAKASQIYAIPDEITNQEAALTEPLAVSLRAVRLAGITLGSSVAIIGAGPIGLLAIQCARLAGANSIYVAQRSEPRASMAKQFGADMVINPEKEDFVYEVRRLTGSGVSIPKEEGFPGMVRKQTGSGVHASLECAGGTSPFDLAVRSVGPGGRVILVSVDVNPKQINSLEIMLGEIEIKGSNCYWSEFADSLELLRLHKIETEGMISKVVSLDDAPGIFNELRETKKYIKVLVTP